MTVVLATGMSGTGKSAALVGLERRGHRVVDTDYGGMRAGATAQIDSRAPLDEVVDALERIARRRRSLGGSGEAYVP